MPHGSSRRAACGIVILASLLAGGALAAERTVVGTFGEAVASTWSGTELECPQSSFSWFDATPETLYCFSVEQSGLSMRARLDSHLGAHGIWLDGWKKETDEIISRPYWSDGNLYRIVLASSFRSPRNSVVFIRLSLLDGDPVARPVAGPAQDGGQ